MDTKGEKSNDRALPQDRADRPRDLESSLNPAHAAGQNAGASASSDREVPLRTAYDEKRVHRALADRFSDEELKQIPIVPPGSRLQQGATYLDLAADRPAELRPNGGVEARDGQLYVAKDRVPYWIWNRLIGDPKPGQE